MAPSCLIVLLQAPTTLKSQKCIAMLTFICDVLQLGFWVLKLAYAYRALKFDLQTLDHVALHFVFWARRRPELYSRVWLLCCSAKSTGLVRHLKLSMDERVRFLK